MSALVPGFTDSVRDCQRSFRAVLEAMSHPASPVRLPVLPPPPESSAQNFPQFGQGMAALALTLCDSQTPLWLQPEFSTDALRAYLRFHCGAPIVADPAEAAFAFIGNPQTMPDLQCFAQGDAAYPERSATLVLAVRLGGSPLFTATGPGIGGENSGEDARPFACQGLPLRFTEQWLANRQGYPLGVDALLLDELCPRQGVFIAGLPRTTNLAALPRQPEA